MHQGKKENITKRWNQRLSMDFNDKIEEEELIINDILLQGTDFGTIEKGRGNNKL